MGASTPPGLSEGKAVRMMAALREGRTLRTFGVRAPRLEAYFKAHPEFAREALPLIEVNNKAALLRKGERKRNLTHCKYGHPLSGDNLYLAPGRKERKCLACLKRRGECERRMSEQQARRVIDALKHDGETITTVTRPGKPTYIVNRRALILFRQKHPKFDRLVVRLSTTNAKVHHAEASARLAQIFRAPVIAEHGADIFALIRSAVPTTLPAQIRDDVIGAMALEIVEGKLRPSDIRRRVCEYISAQFRQFSKYGRVSLDARLFEDGNATLLDRLSTEAGDGYWDINMMASTGRRK
jgi:hypothetical protein